MAFAVVSFARYPSAYGPFTNWLSDLGNPLVSPSGAAFYNLGCIIAGAFQFPFYIGLRKWDTGERKTRVFLTVARVAGGFSAFALIMTAVFPLGSHTSTHSLWSMMVFVGIGLFEIFSATSLRRHSAFPKWMASYGLSAAVVNFIAVAVFETFLGEWIAIGVFISYVLMLCVPLPKPGMKLIQ